MRSHVLTLILLWVVVGGCESKTDIPLSPTAPSPAGTVTVRVEGVVLDSDRDEPVSGVLITPGSVHDSGGHQARIDSPSATTDANGVFALSADVPSDWRNLGLHFSRPGYEAGFTSVDPAESVVLKLRPTLTIRAGESLQVRHQMPPEGAVQGFAMGPGEGPPAGGPLAFQAVRLPRVAGNRQHPDDDRGRPLQEFGRGQVKVADNPLVLGEQGIIGRGKAHHGLVEVGSSAVRETVSRVLRHKAPDFFLNPLFHGPP